MKEFIHLLSFLTTSAKCIISVSRGHPLDDPIIEECRNCIIGDIVDIFCFSYISKIKRLSFGRKISVIIATPDNKLIKDIILLILSLIELLLLIV